MMDTRNLIVAIVLSVLIIVVYDFYFMAQPPEVPPAPAPTTGEVVPPTDIPVLSDGVAPPSAVPLPAPEAVQPTLTVDRTSMLAETPRVRIDSARLHGSIALIGGRMDDLTLAEYRETVDPGSAEIVLLSPPESETAYFAQFGWISPSGSTVPTGETRWTADGTTLSPDNPVTLTWDNGEGQVFQRIISLDEDYMFTVTDHVENTGSSAVVLHPYGFVARFGTPDVLGFYILHEGPLGVFNGVLEEIDYDDLQEDGLYEHTSPGGWIGITDKYWLTALIPDQSSEIKHRFVHRRDGETDKYQVDTLGPARTVAPGESTEITQRFFAGAKQAKLLDHYVEEYGIVLFDRAIDFGWFWWLTKPIFYILIYLKGLVGNFGVAILILTVLIKLLFFPLANKSYRAMSKMKKLQPEMLKLRERFGDDKQRLNQEMMALYRREKANPASGCLPMLIQIPVFFALYKVLFVTIEMRHAPFFGWIVDLSARDPTSLFNLFGLIPWDPATILPAAINIGAWPLVMGASMYLQQKLNPQPADPMQAKIFLMLPIVFTFLLAQFPAGLVIYWAWNNILSILQQWVIMKRAGAT